MIIHADKFQEIYKQPEYANPFQELVDFPLILDLELKRSRGEYMRSSLFYEILKQAREFGTKGIRFGRGGDPLVHRDILRFVRTVRKEEMLVSLETRGKFLYLAMDSLCNSGLTTFVFNAGKYDIGTSKMRNLAIMKRMRKFGPYIKVISTVQIPLDDRLKDACDDYEWFRPPETTRCPEPWRCLQISWSGDALFCPMDYIGISKIGNIQEMNLHDLWHLAKENKRNETYNFCKDCALWRLKSE